MGLGLVLVIVAGTCLLIGRQREHRARAEYEPVEVRLVGRETERRKVVEYGSQTFFYWVVVPAGEGRPRRIQVSRAEYGAPPANETLTLYRVPRSGRLALHPRSAAAGWRTAALWTGVAGVVLLVAAAAGG